MTRKRISFVIPAYNEEECVDQLHAALGELFAQIPQYDYEAVIIENGSHDRTYEKLLAIHQRDPRVKIVKLARNFMTDGGLTAGLKYAKGDAVVLMCADLEDPPHVVLEFIKKWEEGYLNVYGIIRRRQGNWLRRFNSKIFYHVINKLTGGVIPRAVADFRLIDRKVVDAINSMDERGRMMRGMIAWTGFKSCGVPFDRGNRMAGTSKANTALVLKLAFRGIFAFSTVPLRLASIFGAILLLFSALALLFMAFQSLFMGAAFPLLAGVFCVMLFLFGLVFIALGILGEYIGMVFEETKRRPNFIVEETVGF